VAASIGLLGTGWNDGVWTSIVLGSTLEAVVGSRRIEQAIAVDAHLLLRYDVFFFLVQALTREESVFFDVLIYLL